MPLFAKTLVHLTWGIALLTSAVLCSAFPLSAQSQQAPTESQSTTPGSISGRVIDQTGTFVSAAVVKLTHPDQSAPLQDQSTDDGLYSFANVAPGPFEIIIMQDGFTTKTILGTLKPGEALVLPRKKRKFTFQSPKSKSPKPKSRSRRSSASSASFRTSMSAMKKTPPQ
jgi:hypothetical protein